MGDEINYEENNIEKVPVLNKIFEGLVSDISDLIKDLYWGVKTYLFFGLISILFGIQGLVYNIENFVQCTSVFCYIPLFIAGVLIFSGAAQILNFFRLRKKYSRLFKAQEELKKS